VALLTDDGRRTAMAEAGLARAREYDWARIAEAYERVYARVITNDGRDARGAA
jgi:glycosyltransferase involved in cell wall biosynthesis